MLPALRRSQDTGLDYYLVLPEGGPHGSSASRVEGIVVEEFDLAGDFTTTALNGAGWTAADGEWWSSAAFGREMRRDPRLRSRVVAARRQEAEAAYRRLGGGDLPDETGLRARFRDPQPLPVAPPLRFGPADVPEGYHDRRVYRLLFAGEPDDGCPGRLRGLWGMTPPDDRADPGVAGRAGRRTARDAFTWDLRRIGPGVAWSLDLTACLGTSSDAALGPLLRELTTTMRHEGLIPVTVERFS
ncbi:hypothetical protein [Microbispora corallina]|uniref:hypothetical protein n=1 Tax=Microbispora corallina TaxID=83302 RepID=UPI0019524963|nr:hypothetical protein [Microbispora corallina]